MPDNKIFTLLENNRLNSIYEQDINGSPDDYPISSVKGLSLSDAREKAITNSRLLEAGVSIAILDHPGKVGEVYDSYSKTLAKVLEPVLTPGNKTGEQNVFFNGKQTTLHDVFNKTLITPLSSGSDQIGRQPDNTGKDTSSWLLDKLTTPMLTAGGQYQAGNDFKSMLTSIKSISSFGTTLWQLMKNAGNDENRATNLAAIEKLLQPLNQKGNNISADFLSRFDKFANATRNENFDSPVSRMRSERAPLIDGIEVKGVYEPAGQYGLGFGDVMVRSEDPVIHEKLQVALGQNDKGETNFSKINAILRKNAPIQDLSRPFMLSEKELQDIPAEYNTLDIKNKLTEHAFNHGTGVNRWQPYGTFAVESNLRNMPSAGAQSGGTCDILLALNTLSDRPIYGNKQLIEPATLGIAAFMNFGAYHTFAETIPIGKSVAADTVYNPSGDTNAQHQGLYQQVENMVNEYCPQEAQTSARAFGDVHRQLQNTLEAEHPEIREANIEKMTVDSRKLDLMRMPFYPSR